MITISTVSIRTLVNCQIDAYHEEGHRAILTHKGIGSISQPFMKPVKVNGLFLGGAAYVKGVSDNTLKNLRDTDLPSFIRLHVAGIESDYVFSKKAYSLMALNLDYESEYKLTTYFGPGKGHEEKWNINSIEYISRATNIWFYLYDGLSPSSIKLDEEADELERDIVGDDVYGTIHHLFQPEAEYQRYIDYVELTEEERVFAKRIGWRSFLNLPFISPIWFGNYNFNIGENHTFSFNTGYSLAPFGDIGFSVGFMYKTQGYLPEIESHDSMWRAKFGFSLRK